MTIYEIYNQTIKSLRPEERLGIARLILQDLGPIADGNLTESIRDAEHLERLLLDGINSGPMIEATDDYWALKQQQVVEKLGS